MKAGSEGNDRARSWEMKVSERRKDGRVAVLDKHRLLYLIKITDYFFWS